MSINITAMLQMNSGHRTKNVQFGHISVFRSSHPFSLDEISLIFVADARVFFPASPYQFTRETRFPGKAGSRIKDQGSMTKDRGSRIEDRGSRIEDRVTRNNLT